MRIRCSKLGERMEEGRLLRRMEDERSRGRLGIRWKDKVKRRGETRRYNWQQIEKEEKW